VDDDEEDEEEGFVLRLILTLGFVTVFGFSSSSDSVATYSCRY
jgi:hypothetical protein